jgi:hypothetical protein
VDVHIVTDEVDDAPADSRNADGFGLQRGLFAARAAKTALE